MSAVNLDKIFQPKSIAVIGNGQSNGFIFSTLVENLIDGGYSGEVYPVNPHLRTIRKRSVYPSLLELKAQVDLAVLAEPVASASQIVTECIEAGVKGLVMISGGGKAVGATGQALDRAEINRAKNAGIRVIGPDCLGFVCTQSKLNASLTCHMPPSGKMAFVSQSGSICMSVLDLSIKEHVGFGYFVSLGTMMDVDFGDMIDYLGGDYNVGGIVLYLESFGRIRNFMSAARAVSRIKPIIALKSGRTKAGALAIASHTGRLGGEDTVYDAAFERAGIVRVKTFEELFDCAELLAKRPRPLKSGLAIVTNAGSPGVMAVDALSDYGVDPALLKPETIQKLDEFLPSGWSRTNPVDILEDAAPEDYKKVVDVCLKDPEVNGFLIILAPQAMTRPTDMAESLADFLKGKPYPIFTSWMGGKRMDDGREIFKCKGIPTFDTPERAVRAFMNLYRYSENLKLLHEIPPKLPRKMDFDHEKASALVKKGLLRGNLPLTPEAAKDLLTAYGIPVDKTKTSCSDNRSEQDVLKYELAIGSKKDRDFGPVIFFGAGGIVAEVIQDRAVALPPLNRLLARRLLEKSKIYHLLKGFEIHSPENLTWIEEILIRLAQLVTDFPEIEEIDINPLVVSKNDVCAMDVRILLKPAKVPAPHHLVISPYPNQYETRTVREGVGELFIRPIRPEDAPLLVELFDSLSPQSVYFRFFSPLKILPHRMLARFTQIDYDREIALVALWGAEPNEKMLGVARVITDIYNQKYAEFSVIVAESWHGKGIGAELLRRCLSISKERGIETVTGIVLPENTQMLALGGKLGFSAKRVTGESEYKLSIDLANL
ncbi:MAG TPA: GNAT family N-acetyltransferase [Desulfobacterales bacterium]|nr:GNAT family N-acetyltransferase [Desulfobacterales bacterium]